MSPLRPPIRGVAFDIDGTLYSQRRLYRSAIGFALAHARFIYHFSHVRTALRASPRNQHGYNNLYHHQASLLAARLRIAPRRAAEKIERLIYNRWNQRIARQPLYSGVTALLAHLQSRGVPLAIMSDFPVTEKLKAWGIQHYFQHTIECERLGTLKPSPRLFRRLAERMRLAPNTILYVGNSPQNDVEASIDAGLLAAYISERGARHPRAHCNFSTYQALHNFLFSAPNH